VVRKGAGPSTAGSAASGWVARLDGVDAWDGNGSTATTPIVTAVAVPAATTATVLGQRVVRAECAIRV
jgi:hypothetical protein